MILCVTVDLNGNNSNVMYHHTRYFVYYSLMILPTFTIKSPWYILKERKKRKRVEKVSKMNRKKGEIILMFFLKKANKSKRERTHIEKKNKIKNKTNYFSFLNSSLLSTQKEEYFSFSLFSHTRERKTTKKKKKEKEKENSSTSGSQVVTYPSTRLAWGGLTSRSGTRSGANRLVWPELFYYLDYFVLFIFVILILLF